VPLDADVAITPTDDASENRFLKERAESLKGVLLEASTEGRPLLARVRSAILAGRASYYVALFAWLIISIICGYLVSWMLAVAVNRRMSDVFSEFWHSKQLDLRNALKRARQSGAEAAGAKVTRAGKRG
jgi:Mg2+/citrate symporter